MRYNAAGDLAGGIIEVNVNRARLCRGSFGSGAWVDRDTIIANADPEETDRSWALWAFRRATGWKPERWDPRGATTAGGGGGNWMATIQSNPKQTYGVVGGARYDSNEANPGLRLLPDGTPLSQVNVLDGHDDGRLIFTSPDFMSLGVLTGDGRSIRWWYVGPSVNNTATRLIDGGFIFMDASISHALMIQLGGDAPRLVQLVDGPFDPNSFVYGGVRWFLYHNESTWLHPEGSTVGYRFDPSYGPDCFVEPNGTCHVALTPSPGEVSTSIVLVPPFRLGDGMKPLVQVPVYKKFTHPVMVVPFKDPNGDTAAPAEVVVNGNVQSAARPYFAASDSLAGPFKGERLGIYEETKDPAGIAATLQKARQLKTRMAYCNDSKEDPFVPKGFVDCDQLWIELYRFKPDGLQETWARWMHQMKTALQIWPHDIAGVPMFYGMGGPADDDPATPPEVWSVQEILDTLVAVPDVINLDPRIKICAPFEYLRANGITAHPEVREAFEQFLANAKAAGMPTLTPVTPPPSPFFRPARRLFP